MTPNTTKTKKAGSGFTRHPHVVDDLAFWELNPTQYMIFSFILRKTWGWNKDSEIIPLSQFTKRTRLARPTLVRAIKALREGEWIAVSTIKRGKLPLNEYSMGEKVTQLLKSANWLQNETSYAMKPLNPPNWLQNETSSKMSPLLKKEDPKRKNKENKQKKEEPVYNSLQIIEEPNLKTDGSSKGLFDFECEEERKNFEDLRELGITPIETAKAIIENNRDNGNLVRKGIHTYLDSDQLGPGYLIGILRKIDVRC